MFKIKQNGFHQNVQRVQENKDQVAVFMQQLNILCKLSQSYYTQKMLFPTVQLINFCNTCMKCYAILVILLLMLSEMICV